LTAGSERRPTIVDVGRHAGVSTKTVSRVLNNEPYVSEGIRERVLASARTLQYHPNVLARALVSQRSHLIGLTYENPSPSYVVELQMGVLERLRGEPYRLVVMPLGPIAETADQVVGLFRSAALEGVILAPPASDHPVVLRDLQASGITFARVSPKTALEIGPSTLMDEVAAGRLIAEHVVGLGHRDIAVILGDPGHAACEARLQGYRAALSDAGLTFAPGRIAQGLFTRASGEAAARTLLNAADPPTAILCQNDDMAAGALMTARQLGFRAPEDVTIVGFDDAEISRLTSPALTTIRQPVQQMAKAAAGAVIAQLEGRAAPSVERFGFELVVRESSGPPPAR
jgi:LacI family transcriptional regulator